MFACCYADDACAIAEDKDDDLHVRMDADIYVPLPSVFACDHFVCTAMRPGTGAFESVGLLRDLYVLPGSLPIARRTYSHYAVCPFSSAWKQRVQHADHDAVQFTCAFCGVEASEYRSSSFPLLSQRIKLRMCITCVRSFFVWREHPGADAVPLGYCNRHHALEDIRAWVFKDSMTQRCTVCSRNVSKFSAS